MKEAVTQRQIYKLVSCDTGLSARKAEEVIKSYQKQIMIAVLNDYEICMPKFGKFRLRRLKAMEGRNPRTGAAVQLPERFKVVFSQSDRLGDIINGRV